MTSSLQSDYKSYYLNLCSNSGMKNSSCFIDNNADGRVVPSQNDVWGVTRNSSFYTARQLINFITEDTTWEEYYEESRKYRFYNPWDQWLSGWTPMDKAICVKNYNLIIKILKKAEDDAQELQKQLDEIENKLATQPFLGNNELEKHRKNIKTRIALLRNLHMFPGRGMPFFIELLMAKEFEVAGDIIQAMGFGAINAQYGDGVSPLKWALEQKDDETIIWLLSRGATLPSNLSKCEELQIKRCKQKKMEIYKKRLFVIDLISCKIFNKKTNFDALGVIECYVGNIDAGVDESQLQGGTKPKFEEKADETVQIFTVVSPTNTTLSGVWMKEKNTDV